MKKTIFMLLLLLSGITTFAKNEFEHNFSSETKTAAWQPAVPTGLHIVTLDHYKVTFTWDHADHMAGWEVWTSQTIWGGPGYFTTNNQFTIWFDQAWWNLKGNYFRIALKARALNGVTSDLSSHVVVNIPSDVAPSVPQNLRIDEIDRYHVKISWDPVFDDSACIEGFPIWTSQTVWGGSDKYSTTNSYTIYFDDSWYALQGQYFRFALQSEDCNGNKSALSNHVVVNIPAGLPRLTVTALPRNCGSGTIAVTIPSYATGSYNLILDNQRVISPAFGGNTYYFDNVARGNHTVRILKIVDFGPPPPIFPQDVYTVFVDSSAPIIVTATWTSNSISLFATGGSGVYYYALNGGVTQTANLFTGLLPNTDYNITTFDSSGCSVSMVIRTNSNSISINDDSIKKRSNNLDFKCFPNPMKDNLTISNTSNIEDVTIVTTRGEVLLQQKINDLEARIDVSHLPKGIYFAKITTDSEKKTIQLVKE
jgi:Secretion system C-terminal sorting domain